MLKNTAGQTICFQAIDASDGTAVTTGTPAIKVLKDGGVQAAGTGTSAHEGFGVWSYAPTQAETNANHVAFTMTLTNAITHTINVYPSTFDYTSNTLEADIADAVWDEDVVSDHTTADSAGAQLGVLLDSMDTNLDAVLVDTGTTLPGQINALNDLSTTQVAAAVWDAALVSYNDVDTFGEKINDSATATSVADAVWDELQSAHATAGSFGEIATEIAAILVDTGTTLPASLTTIDNEIATIDGNVDAILVDTGTTIPASLTTIDNEIATIDTNVDAILVDTGTTIPATIATVDTNVDAILVDTGTTLPATLATIDSNVATILVDTGTTLPAQITALNDLSQTDVRAAVGLVTANLDTQLGTIDTNVDAILTDTGTTIPAQITALNDPAASAIADAVWDELTTGHTNSGTFGRQIKDGIDGINTHVETNIPADIAALNDPTAAAIADAVWDEVQTGHVTAGTFGYYLDAQVSGAANPPSAADIADAVWDELQADHVTAGSFGVVATEVADILTDTSTTIPAQITALNDVTAAAVADAVWDEATAGHVTAGTFGEQVKTDIDAILTDTETTIPAQITALVIPSSTTIAAAVWDKATSSHTGAGTFGEQCGTDIDAILADTNELQTDDIPTTLAALNDISVADIWSEPQAGYTTAGTFGDNLDQTVSTAGGGGLTVGGIADAVWDEAMSGHTTTGTAGAVFDSANDKVKADVLALNSSTTAAVQLAKSANQIITGTVDTVTNTHTPTVTEFQADDITEATGDHYNSRVIIFTSGNLAGQATSISDYVAVGGIGQFSVVEMTEAPADNDTFIIV